MRVLFLTREYPPFEVGGIAVHAYNLVKNLQKQDVSCKVLSFGDESFSNEEVTFVNTSSAIMDSKSNSIGSNANIPFDILKFSKVANRLLKNEHFDVIHVEEPYVGALVNPKGNQVKVSTYHTTSIGELRALLGGSFRTNALQRAFFYSSIGYFLDLKGIKSSASLLVPTQEIASELSVIYRTPREKIQIIENAVNLPNLDKKDDMAESKEKLGIDPNSILILSLGRLIPRKKVELLIEATRLLRREKLDNFKVAIVGEGQERINLIQKVKDYGLDQIISLPGRVSDEQKDLYYRAANIFALTSSYEGFPINLLEAMSYGDAIVNSKIDCINCLRDGFDSLSFEPGNPYGLTACLKDLINDVNLRANLSTAGRTFAEKRSWTRAAEETRKVYESLL
jgi:glycosyltransferase involved in cell wall biosynthesis